MRDAIQLTGAAQLRKQHFRGLVERRHLGQRGATRSMV
jgi:hypothetical protein